MANVKHSVEVDVPADVAYAAWRDFERFPTFMEGVKSVTPEGNGRLHWVAEVGNQTRSWDAEIVDEDPGRRLAWRSVSGTQNDGVVTFERLGDGQTRVNVSLDVELENPIERVGEAVGLLDHRVSDDLDRFKDYVEQRSRGESVASVATDRLSD
jgi:uncharacterized membrane protein